MATHQRSWLAWPLALGAIVLLGSGPGPKVSTAAPWIIIVHGDLLPQRAVIADWHENLQFLAAVDISTRADTAAVPDRPYVRLAMFWGPEWANYPRTPEALAQLRPEQANQHGRFYPAQGEQGPLVLIGPANGRAYTTLGGIAASGLEVLARYGVPIRVDA